MALHAGAATERGGDYFGPPLNRVVRDSSQHIHGGQVLLSAAIRELLGDRLREGVRLRIWGSVARRTWSGRERIFELVAPTCPPASHR